MRIQCPTCSARYDVPDAALYPGRQMQCARCGTVWAHAAAPPLPAAPEPPAPEPVPAIPDRPAPNPPRMALRRPTPSVGSNDRPAVSHPGGVSPASGKAVAVGWLVSIAVLVAIGWGVVAYRARVAAAWPPSQRVYTALGLDTGPSVPSDKNGGGTVPPP